MTEAKNEIDRALDEDPLHLLFRHTVGIYLFGTGRPLEGEVKLRELIELDEKFWVPYVWICADLVRRGLISEALVFAEKGYRLAPHNWVWIGLLAGILGRTGDEVRMKQLIEKLGDGAAFGAPFGFVSYHIVRSEIDLAADWFVKLIEQRDTRTAWIVPHIFGEVLTSSPRWPALARMMNLPANVASQKA
jgi:hypothetical protein